MALFVQPAGPFGFSDRGPPARPSRPIRSLPDPHDKGHFRALARWGGLFLLDQRGRGGRRFPVPVRIGGIRRIPYQASRCLS